MDGCALPALTLGALIPSWHELGLALGVIYGAAKLTTILVPTPPPNTRWGRVYHAIEVVALVIGHAKETGELPAIPEIDGALQDAIALAKRAKA